MDPLIVLILGIVVIAVATAIGPRLKIAGPLVLVIIGLGVSTVPFVEIPLIEPEIILVGILPPLLYSAAISLPAIEFRRDFSSVFGLSVVLVIVSSLALAGFFLLFVPGLNPLIGLALGAILSPTDAVATSIVKRVGVSRRVVTLLEGESLLNDATALVILRTAIAAVVAGTVSVGEFVGNFAWGVVIAVLVGAVVGYANVRLRAWIANSAANTAIGFIIPFVAYLPTEHLGGSGLVAAVVAGIMTGQGAMRYSTPEQRLSDTLNWRTIELVLEGAVFLIMGLELREIVRGNVEAGHGILLPIGLALGALAVILVVRTAYVSFLVWAQSRRARSKMRDRLELMSRQVDRISGMSDAQKADAASPRRGGPQATPEQTERRLSSMRNRISRSLADIDYYQASPLGWKHGTIIVWAGMRGVVTLAAAQTLPRETHDRPLLIFVAFLVALVSLMLQGFTLPWVVRLLRLEKGEDEAAGSEEQSRLEDELRTAALGALTTHSLVKRNGEPFAPELMGKAARVFERVPDDDMTVVAKDLLELRLALIQEQREKLVDLSHGGLYGTPTLRHALAELDADQLSLELRLARDE
ncbi:cation:proton antiporter [Microbacterium ulmi]|uniref:Sodium:proton antiporter n=1 Tax=Microbacterium ulmi TaxID=179095 RepID=A0A7Y2PYG6_9MICO|nr:sodium:proton antiporter [Microbacterium ulmi]NII69714.1 CPA1 family monovalent cation:H+ antiporter [Microbacterium ulmi]NNH03311.1 sodium:proton antiporter [Microbacterium ulmi]